MKSFHKKLRDPIYDSPLGVIYQEEFNEKVDEYIASLN